ncbi:histidinol-phosphate transaminase [Gulosibacter molinativorax]|uniref:Aromatic amino acid aminotransferase n=1 Tax=Gulosibacter molinativorax TaxID=256821 RepID=A0ABT7C9W7_9MICO|nr:histidinol-phosphate transaminase [Gulosibacter molinativorax]MDJ1371908.1 histidinol-phosphate transaminase [Gulosibacter molinativorax]
MTTITTFGPQPRDVFERIPAYKPGRRATGVEIAPLASNESHHEPLPSVLEAIAEEALRINRYPDAAVTNLHAKLAEKFGVGADQVVTGPGSIGVLQQLLETYCAPGDEVVFAWRSFEAYPLLVEIAGGQPVMVPLRADESHDLDAIAASITDRTRIVLLCTPNNPTGVSLSHHDVVRFLDTVPERVLVVIDEAYVEYETSEDAVDSLALIAARLNVLALRTFSKAYGLAGLRVGYAISTPEIIASVRKAVLTFSVNSLAQRAAIASLDADHELAARAAEIAGERDRVVAALADTDWGVLPSQANFVWIRASGERNAALSQAFDDAGILTRVFPEDGIRVTLADAATNDRVIAVLRNTVGE